MKWSTGKKLATGLVLSLIVLLIVGVVSYKNLVEFIKHSRLETKTYMILKKLEIVLACITDAETGQRGYIITGEDRYLKPYYAAIKDIDQETKKLRELIMDNPNQQRRLDALEPLIVEKLDGLEERISLRKNKGFEAAAQEVRTGKGRIVMDKIRDTINEMENEERSFLKRKSAETEASAHRTIFIIIFGSSLSFVIISIASFITYRELTEHKLAEESLQESDERFRAIFDTAQDSVFIKDRSLKYQQVNPAMERLFDLPASELIGKTDEEIFGEEAGKHIKKVDLQVLNGEIIEVEHTKPVKGVFRNFHVIKVPMWDDSGKVIGLCGIARDITERKRMEEELLKAYAEMEQKVEERTAELHKINESLQKEIAERKHMEEELKTASAEWRITFDSATDMIMLLDTEMKIIKANLATAKFFSKPIKEILDKNFLQLFRVNGMPLDPHLFEKVKQAKKHEEAELYLPDRNIWIRISADPILDDKDNMIRYVYIIRDITERKKVEEDLRNYQEQLRLLASRISLVEERERRRIATDLHDYIGQTLALCKIKLGSLKESVSGGLREDMDEIRDYIEKTIQYIRSLTFELSPPILYELGFEAAVEWLGEDILKKHGILFHFKDDGKSKPMEDETRIILFQAVRELLVNIAKHAQASNASVSIWRDDDHIQINVEDNGIGFDVSKIRSYLLNGRFGFFSINERLRHLGGNIEVKAKPNYGTMATIVIPIKVNK